MKIIEEMAEAYAEGFNNFGGPYSGQSIRNIRIEAFKAALNLPEVKAIREALEFYAKKESWEYGEDLVYHYNIIDPTDLSIPFGYCDKRGGKSRKALADLGKVSGA